MSFFVTSCQSCASVGYCCTVSAEMAAPKTIKTFGWMHVFEGATADEVWLMAASEFSKFDATQEQPSRAGGTQEILGAAFTITDPRQRWIVSRHPAMNPAFALAEVVWILSGRRDSAFINYWNPKLPQFAGNGRN